MNRPNIRALAYWATTIFGPASFVVGGVLGVMHDPQLMSTLQHLGYPPYFATISGAWKILGAFAVVVPGIPRVKEWAYAGFFFELSAAAASRAFVGDSAADIVAPLGFLALVVASWALRPASRKLNAAAASSPRTVAHTRAAFAA